MATKTTKKIAAKKTVAKKETSVMEHECGCGKDCPCKCHGKYHLIKKIIILAIVFSLGMVVGTTLCSGPKHHKKSQVKRPVFVENCLKMDSVANPRLKKALETADVNADNCISREEYQAAKQSIKPAKDMNKNHKGAQGPKAQKGPKAPTSK